MVVRLIVVVFVLLAGWTTWEVYQEERSCADRGGRIVETGETRQAVERGRTVVVDVRECSVP